MKVVLLSILLCTLVLAATRAQEVDYSTASLERLIDDLTLISAPAPGIDGGALYSDFIADDTPPKFVVGLLGLPPPEVPPQMRELVRRGVRALPALIQHLPDERPTSLTVGGEMFMFSSGFSTEYDSRHRTSPRLKPLADCRESLLCFEKPLGGTYVVRVGDVCYVLIGQIVNRLLVAVRYQSSGILIVNSPIEAPVLAERVKAQWGDLDPAGHAAGLTTDVREGKDARAWGDALARLRFYYPAAFASLRGDDLRKRQAFEQDEASEAK